MANRWGRLLVWLGLAAGCCPPKPAGHPGFPVPPPAAADGPRTLPPAVVGRFEVTTPEPPAPPPIEAGRELLKEPPYAPPAGPKVEHTPPARETLAPPASAVPRDTLPDEVVMRLLESGRAAFVRCFKKAVSADPTVFSFKVRLHVELDENGAITSSSTDASDPALSACLARSAGWLKYPASGKPVVVDLPLFYRAE